MRPTYPKLIEAALTSWPLHTSRLGDSREQLDLQVTFPAGEMFKRPGVSRRLMWVEVLQAVGGYFDRDELTRAAPKAVPAMFDIRSCFYKWGGEPDVETEHSVGKVGLVGYVTGTGKPRIGYKAIGPGASQFDGVVRQLRQHPESRRALAHLGERSDGYEETKPCATLLQFQVRQGQLHMSAYQRSWDLIHGFIYDTAVYGAIAQSVAACLGIGFRPTVTVTAGSAHVYLKDAEAGKAEPDPEYRAYFTLPDFRSPAEYRDWARSAMAAWPWVNWTPPGVSVRAES